MKAKVSLLSITVTMIVVFFISPLHAYELISDGCIVCHSERFDYGTSWHTSHLASAGCTVCHTGTDIYNTYYTVPASNCSTCHNDDPPPPLTPRILPCGWVNNHELNENATCKDCHVDCTEECTDDYDCDDGLYCTGVETCVNLNCQLGAGDPCAGAYQSCNEALDNCTECTDDYDCDNETDSEDNCMTVPNSPVLGTCVREVGNIIMGTGVPCTSNDNCTSGEYCQMEQGDINENGVGDVCECYADLNNSGSVLADDGNILSFEWMQGVYPQHPCDPDNETNCRQADMNNSGSVLADDGNILSYEWMKGVYPGPPCPDRVPPCTEFP